MWRYYNGEAGYARVFVRMGKDALPSDTSHGIRLVLK